MTDAEVEGLCGAGMAVRWQHKRMGPLQPGGFGKPPMSDLAKVPRDKYRWRRS